MNSLTLFHIIRDKLNSELSFGKIVPARKSLLVCLGILQGQSLRIMKVTNNE